MVTSYEYVTVQGDFITVDLLVWRRYKIRTPGIVELTMDINPHLAYIHATTPFLPVGTQVKIPIDFDVLRNAPQSKQSIELYNGVL